MIASKHPALARALACEGAFALRGLLLFSTPLQGHDC